MKRILFFILIVGGSISLTPSAHALYVPFYTGARCLGMGGACVAVVDDETALMENPSALGKLRDNYGTILDPEVEGNANVPGLDNNNYVRPFDLSNLDPELDSHRGTQYHAKAQVFPSFVGRNFGIGLLGNYQLDANMNSAGTQINTFYRNDYALIFGFNFRFFEGRIKVGVNGRLISRIEVNNPSVSTSSSLDYSKIASEGLGLGSDASIMFTAPWQYLPTLTAVVRDIGGTSFNKADNIRLDTTTRPSMVPETIDIGAALFPIYAQNFRASWTVEYRGLLLPSSDVPTAAAPWHGGVEFNFGDTLFLRGGYNEGYWTAGAELSAGMFQWQIATYGEEIGTTTTGPIQDRRYDVKVAFRF